jgi:hypothetical protein
VHTTYPEEHPMSQTNNYDSYHSSDAQLTDKPHELGSDDDVEGLDEKIMSGSEEVAACKASGDKCTMRYTSQSARLIGLSANCTQ